MSPKQLITLQTYAAAAYARQVKTGAWQPGSGSSKTADARAFRHALAARVTGGAADGFKDMPARFFERAMHELATLAGNAADAAYWAERGGAGAGNEESNLRRQWAHLLEQICADKGVAYPAYPLAIHRAQTRQPDATLEGATAAQLKRLHTTVRNRKARTPAPAAPKPEDCPF